MTGAEYRALRERLGLTQEALARHLEVSHMTVSRWETGARRITKRSAGEIKRLVALGVPDED